MEKQTSIDWFIDKLPIRMKNYLNEEIKTARKMYKQDIIDAYNNVMGDENGNILSGEEHYQETFGNKQ